VLAFNPGGALTGATNLAVAGTTVYVCCNAGVVAVDIEDPRQPKILATVGAPHVVQPKAISVQFRYAFVADAQGLEVLDVTFPARMRAVEGARVAIPGANDVYVARTHAYVAAGSAGLAIVDVESPEHLKEPRWFTAGGAINDARAIKVGMTNDSVYAYVADGKNGLRVIQVVTPEDGGRSAYGFSPPPLVDKMKLIATWPSSSPCVAVARGLDRDRAVDESGHQMAVFGRIGGRPMNLEEMQRLYLRGGAVYTVSN
jgi:hypothetical protein